MESFGASRIQIEVQSYNEVVNIAPNVHYKYFKIEQVTIPHTWNYVPAGFINFYDSLNTLHMINYPTNQFSIIDFSSFLVAEMDSLDTGGATYTFIVNNYNNTWTLSSDIGTFSIDFDQYAAQHYGVAGLVTIGRYGMTFPASSYTSGNFFFGTQNVTLSVGITSVGQGTSLDNFSQASNPAVQMTNQNDYIINLPVKSAIGDLETWYIGDYSPKYHFGQNSNNLTVRLNDEYGLPINIIPQRWYFTLIYYNK
jgi:hypothetical protein